MVLTEEKLKEFIDNPDKAVYFDIRAMAGALLAESEKPKVWDCAPDNADRAHVLFFTGNTQCADVFCQWYTRDIPKSAERKIAEEKSHKYFQSGGMMPITEDEIADVIESAINEYKALNK